MKLIKTKVRYILRQNRKHVSTKESARDLKCLSAEFSRSWMWVRYERKHSLYAGHIDWHGWDGTGIKVYVVLDDASPMVLAGGEFTEINTNYSIEIITNWSIGIGGSVPCGSKSWIMEPILDLIEFAMMRAGTANSKTI